ncbi:exodeoxyribonuclease III [Encephalitozoon romaleae SJ-2008]|nr:exodeoxyribonuclease III [Encephalitozoon romaleae SJ-2008]AFN83225.1 exodeoxyribonuclease III [Encephalitozoon romaleae SJ-2008]
MGSSRS